MKKIIFIAIFMVSWVSTAQINLRGVVKDSIGNPLEMANVTLQRSRTPPWPDTAAFYH